MPWWSIVLICVGAFLVLVAVYDLTQKRHAILRNFPIIGHLRYILEWVGPELRQYIVTDNNEERPFSRDQRRWVYATAKQENSYFGFGTDDQIDAPGHVIIKHSAFPVEHTHDLPVPAGKVLGEWRDREHAFRPSSIVNISAMSFGSLSDRAVEALNRGAHMADCLHNTGEGGISDHHRHGGELIFQVGTGYFGARNPDGTFSLDRLVESAATAPTRAIELKLSQGAKPGLGGLLPGAKVTPAIAAARGVEVGVTVASPSGHSAFHDIAGMVQLIETVAAATGLPVGIKAAVGQMGFWRELAAHMADTGRGPDFITIDGGEGGTGAAPLAFTDHVAYPFRTGMAKVYQEFADQGLNQQITFMGAGKLGYTANAMVALALGCDIINVAREPMMALGCIQAQKCHTGHCPTGVATQHKRLVRGLDVASKAERTANYIQALRADLLKVAHAGGVQHPALLPASAVEIVQDSGRPTPVTDYFDLTVSSARLSDTDRTALQSLSIASSTP